MTTNTIPVTPPQIVSLSSGDDDNKYTEAFFQQWLSDNQAQLEPLLPQLDPSHWKFFTAACQHVQDCNAALAAAIAHRNEIQKHQPVDADALNKANQAVNDATAALERSQTDCLPVSLDLLDAMDSFAWIDSTWRLLVTTDVLMQATPKGLAEYCASSTPDRAEALVQLLQDPENFGLMESMVLAGGAKNAKYGPALELYRQLQVLIVPSANHQDSQEYLQLWKRMALAIALEFAEPLVAFGHTNDLFIDPIRRFQHYQQAVRFGELDPVFVTQFGVWELRMALNSVAPDDQLTWGRQMLKNYRPDLMELNDQWRYCRIVRTDVFYTGQPNWDATKPLDFPQVLSGGGECGPRAWMGRFICRAFGIPVWGVKEPGHAAMARWTANDGWIVCLGAPMQYAWWDDEAGLHFQVQAAARKVLQPKDDLNQPNKAYGQRVMALEWMANLKNEPVQQVVSQALPDPTAIYRSLSLMQMRRLAAPPQPPSATTESLPLVPQLERSKLRNAAITECITTTASGIIIIPATTCTTKPSSTVMFMDSFLGGKQLFLDKDGHAEYTLVSPPGGKFHLICHIVTVHDDKVKPPLLVTIDGGDSSKADEDWGDDGVVVHHNDSRDNLCSVYSIPLQCTWGMWDETLPVIVELPAGVATCQIAISREATAHGLVIKDLTLVPV